MSKHSASQRFTLDEFDDLLSDLEGNIGDIDDTSGGGNVEFDDATLDDLDALVEDLALDDKSSSSSSSSSSDGGGGDGLGDLDDVLQDLEFTVTADEDGPDFSESGPEELPPPPPPMPTSQTKISAQPASLSFGGRSSSSSSSSDPPPASPPRPRVVQPVRVTPANHQPEPRAQPRPRQSAPAGVVHYRMKGPREVSAGQEATYIIESANDNNQSVDVEEHRFRGEANGPENLNAIVRRTGRGQTSVSFHPTQGGSFRINIFVDNKSMFKNELMVSGGGGGGYGGGGRSGEQLNFSCQGAGINSARVNKQTSFTIQVTSQSGGSASLNVHDLKIRLEGPTTVNATVHDRGGGRYEVSYVASTAGEYLLYIVWQGQDVLSAPNRVFVSREASASHSVVFNFPNRVPRNQKTSFSIRARDSNGQDVQSGGDSFSVSVSGPDSPQGLVMRDNANGTYSVEFTILGQGTYTFHITLNGQHVNGSPLDLRT